MMPEISAEPVLADPLQSELDLPLRRMYYPLGFPLQLETNSPDVIEAAAEGWGRFPQLFDDGPVRMCLAVSDSQTPLSNLRSHVRSREHMMSIFADPENFVVCDFNRHFAFGWVTRAVAADHSLLRYRFLISPGLSMIAQLGLAPLHGALIERAGQGVMLCGESCAGKSTLAYACARAGWTLISDDGASLVRKREDRYAIGDPYAIRLRPDSARFFAELSQHVPVTRPNGKTGLEVFTSELPIRVAHGCAIEHVVFLDRRESGAARMRRHSHDQALEYFERFAAYGTFEIRAEQKRCYRRLLEAGIRQMQYADLGDAIACLERLVDSGA